MQQVSSRDRGLNYGDGFFTTVKISAGKLERWEGHLKRLAQCASALYFPELDFRALTERCECASREVDEGVLKVVITRGEGGRGYGLPDQAQVTTLVSLSAYPAHYNRWREDGITLAMSDVRLGHQPMLAGLKTLNRLEQVLIKQNAAQKAADDVLVMDLHGQVIESSAANILIYKDKQWYTPDLSQCGIQGVYLSSLQQHNPIKRTSLSLESVYAADAVYVCNSLMGLVPVRQISNHHFSLDNAHAQAKELVVRL
ncbi:aminodeoxychorismate lyase [Pseudoalteromonas rubra]|uniref:Aminodeoxychorismate lyase n=1 Tax=Pseudoalteromonas rubra TaxID=43658 RepID=A0A5S3WKH8_9GAMM|nr:aminodeoxychorismate lyase [Pseudoalteromonas rubra]TMP26968.1 aminodeoxychorismate lyase [Pseudoalteromonas rubra]TMP27686.1 aminodeoxychorismate lyase [Pseudoalteromonas rubra]